MVDTVRPEDDYFHTSTMTDSPFWNESAWFPFYVAERDLSGFVYMNHRPNMNFSMTGVALWDPSGEEMYDCLYHDWYELAPLNSSTNTEMFDYATPNSLTLRCLEPQKAFTMQYDRDGCQLDLRFDATMGVANSGFPDGSEEWGPHHYEQGGRVTGTIRTTARTSPSIADPTATTPGDRGCTRTIPGVTSPGSTTAKASPSRCTT